MSCGAACVRQVLIDAKVDVDEPTIRAEAGFDPIIGIEGRGIVAVLEKHLHPARFTTGSVPPYQLDALALRAPFFALLRTAAGRHWVIVDAIDDERARVRDPAGVPVGPPDVGADAVILRFEFLNRWRLAINGAVWRL